MSRVVHFEISATNPAQVGQFYADVFGWGVHQWDGPQEYWLLKTGEAATPGIDGGIMVRQEGFPSVVNTINVGSVDEVVVKIVASGGAVMVPKMAVPHIGYMTYCTDPEGNTFGVMPSDPTAS